jgi:hypothetical protein
MTQPNENLARAHASSKGATANHMPLAEIPSTPYVLACGVGLVLSVGGGVGVAALIGAGTSIMLTVGIVAFVVGLLFLAPVLGKVFLTPETWGLAVLGATVVQTMLTVGAMMVALEGFGLDRRPTVVGLLTSSVIMMMVEAGTAVWLLTMREKQRTVIGSSKLTHDASAIADAGKVQA